jgi:cellulose synthase operon protein C
MLHVIKAQLSQMTQNTEAVSVFVAETERAVRQNPTNKEYREVVAWLYLEKEDYQKALDAHKAISRLNNDKGLALFLFAQTALNADYFDTARLAYESVIQAYGQEALAANAREGLFDLLIKQAENAKEIGVDAAGNRKEAPLATAALAAGKDFLQSLPNHPSVSDVQFKMAKLYKDVFADYAQAGTLYSQLLNQYSNGALAEESQFALAEMALAQNNVANAKLGFTKLYERLRTGAIAERTQLELAKINFYEGRIATAFSILDAMDGNTATDVSNDAIRLKVVIRENKGPDSLNTALTEYGKAKLFERQRRGNDALLIYDQLLVKFPDHKLADEIKFDKAQLYRQTGKTSEALSQLITLRTEHADSYLADQALFWLADTYENIIGDKQQALLQYTGFLVQYPGSLLSAEVRARIRKIRGERS